MTGVLLEANGLTKVFGKGRNAVTAVDQINFVIRRNEIVGLVGESGSGKSTLGKLLVGLHERSAGHVRYADKQMPRQYSAADFKQTAGYMQMIFQDPYSSLNPRMTVAEIIAEGLRINGGFSAEVVKQRVVRALKMVGLSADFLSRYPHEFSGGQRQRIGIARALIVEPEFIVCDEPLSALDVSVQAQVVNLLKSLQSKLNLTLLFIAHDLSMVRYISDRILVMYHGRLVESGPTDRVFTAPKHPYTQALIAANPVADPQQERTKIKMVDKVIDEKLPVPAHGYRGCLFANRCPHVMDVCYSHSDAFTVNGTELEHNAACLLNKEIG